MEIDSLDTQVKVRSSPMKCCICKQPWGQFKQHPQSGGWAHMECITAKQGEKR